MLLTMCEFSKKYDLQRVEVNTAVRNAGLTSDRKKPREFGREAALYREVDLINAYKDYCLYKRSIWLDGARHWQSKAMDVINQYKRKKEEKADDA